MNVVPTLHNVISLIYYDILLLSYNITKYSMKPRKASMKFSTHESRELTTLVIVRVIVKIILIYCNNKYLRSTFVLGLVYDARGEQYSLTLSVFVSITDK